MANCFTGEFSVNPINQAIMSLTDRRMAEAIDVYDGTQSSFVPPYDARFQPVDKAGPYGSPKDPLLAMAIPTLPDLLSVMPPNLPIAQTIGDLIAPLAATISQIFIVAGPIFIVLQIIKAIIDIICNLFNPIPLAIAIGRLLLLLASKEILEILPQFAAIKVILDVIKIIVAICLSVLAEIIPILYLIAENAGEIALRISEGNAAAVDAITTKICLLFKRLDNQLGLFGPLFTIIDMINWLMSLSIKLGCGDDGGCCDDTNCPPVLINPATSVGNVLLLSPDITLAPLFPDFMLFDGFIQFSTSGVGTDGRWAVAGSAASGPNKVAPGTRYNSTELLRYNEYITSETESTLDILLGTSAGNYIYRARVFEVSEDITDIAAQPQNKRIIVRAGNFESISTGQHVASLSGFTITGNVYYEFAPNESELVKQNKIGSGCSGRVREDQQTSQSIVAANTQSIESLLGIPEGSGDFDGFEPVSDKIVDGYIHQPPIDALRACLEAFQANPLDADSAADCVTQIINDYISEVTHIADQVICVGASRIESEFAVDKTTVFVGGDSAELTLKVATVSGTNILDNAIPSLNNSVSFSATHGTVGPVTYDGVRGVFRASFTAEQPGNAVVSAVFRSADANCVRPAEVASDNSVREKTLSVSFIPDTGQFRKRRQDRQYVQKRGGGRR